ncbi:MAG: Fic family protein [Desulfovibrionaceae bacterium]|nr:Fic family protein [Desulfovibrionaceae bacterium]
MHEPLKFESFVSGTLKQQYEYKSFSPIPVNRQWYWEDPSINTLLEQATRSLAGLDAFSNIVPDIDLYIQMHVIKEASTSSKIEGTRTGMDEALMDEEDILPERRDDWKEVQNYIRAMNDAIDALQTLPLSNRLLKQTHATLLQSVRGEHKTPGEFRKSQNWIGGSSLKDASFIPPDYAEVPDLASDLELFWHNESVEVPHLIKVAISHYQFETIHPFLDGNGRIGRLLIPLYLINAGLLAKPSLYLSAHLEKHRASYYDALTAVRTSNDITHWVKFFLNAVHTTALKGQETFKSILALRNEVEKSILSLGAKAKRASALINHLYRKPLVSVNEAAALLGVTHQTANALIKDFEQLDILKELTGFKRNRLYFFHDYYNLFMV